MKTVSLCSGIGGIELGLSVVTDSSPACFVEKDPWCRNLLSRRWPGVDIFEDIYDFDGNAFVGCDAVVAGFPCQPWSLVGKRKGVMDERWILPRVLEIVDRVKPSCVFLENVPGFLRTEGMQYLLHSLAELGFDAVWDCFKCSDMGASHHRNRVFFLAYSDSTRFQKWEKQYREEQPAAVGSGLSLWSGGPGSTTGHTLPVELKVCGMDDGIPRWVDDSDRTHRIRALGNAVSPIAAAVAWTALTARVR